MRATSAAAAANSVGAPPSLRMARDCVITGWCAAQATAELAWVTAPASVPRYFRPSAAPDSVFASASSWSAISVPSSPVTPLPRQAAAIRSTFAAAAVSSTGVPPCSRDANASSTMDL